MSDDTDIEGMWTKDEHGWRRPGDDLPMAPPRPGWTGWNGWDEYAAAAMNGIIRNPAFFGPIFQQSPEAAAEFGARAADAMLAEREKRNV